MGLAQLLAPALWVSVPGFKIFAFQFPILFTGVPTKSFSFLVFLRQGLTLAQAGLELITHSFIFLPRSPQCCGYKCAPPRLAYTDSVCQAPASGAGISQPEVIRPAPSRILSPSSCWPVTTTTSVLRASAFHDANSFAFGDGLLSGQPGVFPAQVFPRVRLTAE